MSLVRFYSTPPIAKDELLARIRADATVSEPVRERALQFALKPTYFLDKAKLMKHLDGPPKVLKRPAE